MVPPDGVVTRRCLTAVHRWENARVRARRRACGVDTMLQNGAGRMGLIFCDSGFLVEQGWTQLDLWCCMWHGNAIEAIEHKAIVFLELGVRREWRGWQPQMYKEDCNKKGGEKEMVMKIRSKEGSKGHIRCVLYTVYIYKVGCGQGVHVWLHSAILLMLFTHVVQRHWKRVNIGRQECSATAHQIMIIKLLRMQRKQSGKAHTAVVPREKNNGVWKA